MEQTLISISYAASDAALGTQIRDDLATKGGYTVADGAQPGADSMAVVVLSPAAWDDRALKDNLYAALDNGQWVIPVIARPMDIPKLINHLEVVDATGGYDFAALDRRIKDIQASPERFPVRVHTPKVRQANRRTGAVLVSLVALLFVISLWAIIAFDIEAPQEEFEAEDTRLAETRDVLITETMAWLATSLPRSTEQAEAFPATLRAAQTRVRPFFGGTATAIHEQLLEFNSTPTPDTGGD
jgi:hypothetical protein